MKTKKFFHMHKRKQTLVALKKAIQEGIDSGISHCFDPKKHLESLKEKKHSRA